MFVHKYISETVCTKYFYNIYPSCCFGWPCGTMFAVTGNYVLNMLLFTTAQGICTKTMWWLIYRNICRFSVRPKLMGPQKCLYWIAVNNFGVVSFPQWTVQIKRAFFHIEADLKVFRKNWKDRLRKTEYLVIWLIQRTSESSSESLCYLFNATNALL